MDDPYRSRHRETERKTFGEGEEMEGGSATPKDTGQLLMMIASDMETFRTCIQNIGTQFDSSENHRELKRLRSSIKKNLSECNKKLKAESKSQRTGPGRIQLDRMGKQLEGHVGTFNELLQQEKTVTRQARSDSSTTSPTAHSASPDYSQQAQAQTQLGMGALQTREEEASELLELERDILDLHDIQQGLAGMVYEQGETIDVIEKNTSSAQVRVEHGGKHLKKAASLKRKNRKLKCCIATIVIIIIIIVLAAIAIGVGVGVSQAKD